MTHINPEVVVDWDLIQQAAIAAMNMAYAPYSNFPVGVAALVDDGRIATIRRISA